MRYANWDDVSLKLDRIGEPEQSQIVLEGLGVEGRMRDDRLHAPLHVRIWLLMVANVELAESVAQRRDPS